jgi:hypothetical protein
MKREKPLKILHILSQRPDSTGSGIYIQAPCWGRRPTMATPILWWLEGCLDLDAVMALSQAQKQEICPVLRIKSPHFPGAEF